MGVICDASVIVGYDKRRSGLPSAPLDVKKDADSIREKDRQTLEDQIRSPGPEYVPYQTYLPVYSLPTQHLNHCSPSVSPPL